MLQVKFYDTVEDDKLKFAVIISKNSGKWVFCKHKLRDTFEFPGGKREPGETITETAKRELYEETGAIKYTLKQICVYSVTGKNTVNTAGDETFGMLYFAEIDEFEKGLHNEIEGVFFTGTIPENLTYPEIQPKLVDKIINCGISL